MRDRDTGLLVSVALLVCALATAANWQTVSSGAPHAKLPKKALQSQQQKGKDELTLRGCFDGTEHLLTPEWYYRLLGSTSELRPYNQRYVAIVVKKPQKQPAPLGEITVEFIRLIGVLPRPPARLNAAVRDFSRWITHAISHYGLNFAVPDIFSAQNVPRVVQGSEFLNKKGTVQLASFRIPAETYSGASFKLGSSPARAFGGGSFAFFANPEITNDSSCSKFENPDPNSLLSSLIVRGIHYSEHRDDVVALGSGYFFDTFHTFQHRTCFAVSFELVQANTANFDEGCMIPAVSPKQERDLIGRVLSRVTFPRPRRATSQGASPPVALATPHQ